MRGLKKCIIFAPLFALSLTALYPGSSVNALSPTDCRFDTYNVYPSSVDSTKVTITGTIKDSVNNQPCADLFLWLFDPATTELKHEARTDAIGNFVFTYDDQTEYSPKSFMLYLLTPDTSESLDQRPSEFITGIQPTPTPDSQPVTGSYWSDEKVKSILDIFFIVLFDILFVAWLWHALTRD